VGQILHAVAGQYLACLLGPILRKCHGSWIRISGNGFFPDILQFYWHIFFSLFGWNSNPTVGESISYTLFTFTPNSKWQKLYQHATTIIETLSLQVALFLTSVIIMPMFLVSGFFVHLDDISPYLSWLSYISIFRYGLESAMIAIYGFNRKPLQCNQIYCHYKYPQRFLEDLGIKNDDNTVWFNLSMLCVFLLVSQLMLYLVLRYKAKHNKMLS
jgi:ABC-2 type transporter.